MRDRLRGGQGDALHEHQKSFAPYSDGKKRKKGFSNVSAPKHAKLNHWSTTFVCLASKDAYQVPGTVAEKETLLEAGLGEVKVDIPNVECSTQEFYGILTSTFPKLQGVGGFQLLRCIANTRMLEPISVSVPYGQITFNSSYNLRKLRQVRHIYQAATVECGCSQLAFT